MLKKYLFVLFLFLHSHNIHASVWDDVEKCLKNPCNCGASNVNESWKGVKQDETRGLDPYCPPYNRSEGRAGTCLLKFHYPSGGYYSEYCAEPTPEGNYFEPKIRVRYQTCNFAGCWTKSTALDWDGDCVVWAGAYAIPLVRICARVAVPAVAATLLNPSGSPADPGYTPGKHLAKTLNGIEVDIGADIGAGIGADIGVEVDDKNYIDIDGKSIPYNRPKLCAYSDPGLVNLISDTGVHLDPLDYNPNHQPLHATTEMSPIAKVLYSLIDLAGSGGWPAILGQLLDLIGTKVTIPGLSTIQEVIKYIGKVVNFGPEIFKGIIKLCGSLNKTVDPYNFGCVEIPIGPYPPPYCKILGLFVSSPTIQRICSKRKTDNTCIQNSDKPCVISKLPNNIKKNAFIQNSDEPCVVSELPNNIINNSVRVSLHRIVPICRNNEDISATDTCVKIRNLQHIDLPSVLHEATGLTDIIPKCTTADTSEFCVDTSINYKCSVTEHGCNKGIRIVYGQKIGNSSLSQDYYVDDPDIIDCGSPKASTTCQEIWGVNLGEFQDVSLIFPEVQDISDFSSLIKDVTLHDNTDAKRVLSVSIARFKGIVAASQDPKDICLKENTTLAGCIERATGNYSILTYECGEPLGLCPSVDYYNPQFIATMKVFDNVPTDTNEAVEIKTYQTSVVATPLSASASNTKTTVSSQQTSAEATPLSASASNTQTTVSSQPPASNPTSSSINLAGYNFNTFMAYIPEHATATDVYSASPFTGSLNAISKYGVYEDNIPPYYDDTKKVNTTALYLHGLEYLNGKYIQGGTHGCMMPDNSSHCTTGIDDTNCVLTNLLEVDTVDCEAFANLKNNYAQYPGYIKFKICTPSDINCQIVGTEPGPAKGLTINKCDNDVLCYVNNDKNGTEVCKVSFDILDRIDPDPLQISIANQHYKIIFNQDQYSHNTTVTYNQKTQGLRDKTAKELNLCAGTFILQCPAIEAPSGDNNGNAIWGTIDSHGKLGSTNVGTLVIGTCPDGWAQIDPNKPLQRYCLSDISNRNSKWQSLPPGVGCKKITGLDYSHETDMTGAISQLNHNYDPILKTGTFTLGSYSDDFYDGFRLNDTLKHSTITFEIPDKNKIKSFQITSLVVDDYTLVTLNGNKIMSGPENDLKSMSWQDNSLYIDKIYINKIPGKDQGRATIYLNTNLLYNLKNGSNVLTIQAGVIGGGGMYYKIQYELK